MRSGKPVTSKGELGMSLEAADKLIRWQFWISEFCAPDLYLLHANAEPEFSLYIDDHHGCMLQIWWTGTVTVNCALGSKRTDPYVQMNLIWTERQKQGERSGALQLTSLPSQHIPGQALFLNTSSPRSVSHRGQVDKSLWTSRGRQWPSQNFVHWLAQSPHRKTLQVQFKSHCVEVNLCSRHACVGFLQTPQFSTTVQKYAP